MIGGGIVSPDDIRFGPNIPIPVRGDSWFWRLWRVQDAINAAGDGMVQLRWDWPAPYNGEQRRARRRLEGKVVLLEKIVNKAGEELLNVAQLVRNPYPPGQLPFHVLPAQARRYT